MSLNFSQILGKISRNSDSLIIRCIHSSRINSQRPLSQHELDYSFVELDAKEQRSKMEKLCNVAGIKPKIGFIGGGNMAQALIKGFISSGLVKSTNIGVSEPNASTLHQLKELDVVCSADSTRIMSQFNDGLIFLAVKPNILQEAVNANIESLSNGKSLIVSIIAGATTESIAQILKPLSLPIIRVMPNTCALVSSSASVFATGEGCTSEQAELIQLLMETVGTCHRIPESQVDAACGLSGSGPAFVYTFLEALSDSGVKAGLPRELATHLAGQMVMGSAKTLLETGKHPGELKNQVCSPGGTTIAGVQELEESGLRSSVMRAVEVAINRAKELGKQ